MSVYVAAHALTAAMLVAVGLAACAAPGPTASGEDQRPASAAPNRQLVIMVRGESPSIAAKSLEAGLGFTGMPTTMFNAGLTTTDADSVLQPYLATALPQINTDSWHVFPDGRMETTYQLRPGLTWHDGKPLTAEDFVFAWRVYATPTYVTASSAPLSQIQEVTAPDSRTIFIRWKGPYPEANALTSSRLQALPRHILEEPVRTLPAEALGAHSFWTDDYVGLGPYRLTRWERSAFVEGEGFDGYVRGKPKIERIKMAFTPDSNTALANILAGESHTVGDDDVITLPQAIVLKREWDARGGGGTILFMPSDIRRTESQLHPERANPKAILDLRVRKALAHAVDKQIIRDVVFEGQGLQADVVVRPSAFPYFSELERVVAKYPFDVRRAEQLMNEAGFAKGSDGYFAGQAEGRLNFEVKAISSPRNESMMSIMADGWRRAGFDMAEVVFPSTQVSDREGRAQFRSMFTTDSGSLETLGTDGIPVPENRWGGNNRGSWSDPNYDRLVAAYRTSLDPDERKRWMIEMAKLYSEQLPSTPVVYGVSAAPFVNTVKGVIDDSMTDIHLWHWVS